MTMMMATRTEPRIQKQNIKKGAGRKTKEPGKKQESKAMRVPLSIFEAVKTLSDLVKEDASYAERFEKFVKSCTQI